MKPMTKERLEELKEEVYKRRRLGPANYIVESLMECLSEIQRLRGALDEMRKSLEWAKEEIEDGTAFDQNDAPQTPDHSCGYVYDPESGHCDFHSGYSAMCECLSPSDETEVTK